MKRLYYSVLLILFTVFASAQPEQKRRTFDPSRLPSIGILSGFVVDSLSGQPIPYASISIVSQRNQEIVTGGISNEQGRFKITEIRLGRYKVIIEYIGYKKIELGPIGLSPRGDGIEQDLGEIRLGRSVIKFDEVQVTGERPLFVQTAEKKIFNVEKNSLTTGGTALDALQQVPGVDVDIDGNVSLRGSTNVNILIDGKPFSLAGGDKKILLENMSADNISDIEVITNPSAKYDPEGMAGIINIVLKENRLAGLNGSFNAGASGNGRYSGSSQVNLRNEKFNIFANLGLRHDTRDGGGDNYREMTIFNDLIILDQILDFDRERDNLLLKSGIELFLKPKHSLSLQTTYNMGDGISDGLVETKETRTDILEYFRTTDGLNGRDGQEITFAYDWKIMATQKFSAYFSRSSGANDRDEIYLTSTNLGYSGEIEPDHQKINSRRSSVNTDFQADYIHPIGKSSKFEAGYSGRKRSIESLFNAYDFIEAQGEYIFNDTVSNDFVYDEDIQAIYIQYSRKSGILGYQAGLRLENVSTMSFLKNTGEKFKNPYTSYFPSATLTLGSPQSLQIQSSYSRRIRRPSHRRLNPFIRQSDKFNIFQGEPFLKPEYIDAAELNLSRYKNRRTLSIGIYYRRVTDKISRYKYLRDDGISVSTYANSDEQRTFGAEMIISGSLNKVFRLMLNGNIYQDEVNAANVFGEDYDRTATGYMARITTTWIARPGTEVMFSGFYRGPRDIPIGKIESMTFSSLSVKQKFMDDRLAVSLRLNDVFNTMGFKFHTFEENYFQDSSRKWESQVLTMTVEYRFGKMEDRRSRNRNQRNRGNNDYDGMGEMEIE